MKDLWGYLKEPYGRLQKKTILTNVQLLTELKEAEAAVNSRPLAYVGDDIQSHITRTPSHFLGLNTKIGIPDLQHDTNNDYNPNRNASDRLLEK